MARNLPAVKSRN